MVRPSSSGDVAGCRTDSPPRTTHDAAARHVGADRPSARQPGSATGLGRSRRRGPSARLVGGRGPPARCDPCGAPRSARGQGRIHAGVLLVVGAILLARMANGRAWTQGCSLRVRNNLRSYRVAAPGSPRSGSDGPTRTSCSAPRGPWWSPMPDGGSCWRARCRPLPVGDGAAQHGSSAASPRWRSGVVAVGEAARASRRRASGSGCRSRRGVCHLGVPWAGAARMLMTPGGEGPPPGADGSGRSPTRRRARRTSPARSAGDHPPPAVGRTRSPLPPRGSPREQPLSG